MCSSSLFHSRIIDYINDLIWRGKIIIIVIITVITIITIIAINVSYSLSFVWWQFQSLSITNMSHNFGECQDKIL